MGSLRDFLIDLGRNAYGLGENVASLGSAAIAEPVAGYAAMFDPVNGAQAIREGMTYQPRTEAGRMYQQGAAQAVGKAVKPVMPVVDTWQKGVDIAGRYSPTLGALMQTAPTALGVALGAKPTLQAGRQASNTLGAMQARMIANANAPRTLNTGFRRQRGSVGTQRPLTEFEQAHLIAQQNAALPVSQGGLGLAPDNTAMDRARAMGFDVDNPMYHGTNQDINEFLTSGKGKTTNSGAFFTDNPSVASTYSDSKTGVLYPVLLKNGEVVNVEANGSNWNWLKKNIKITSEKTKERKAINKNLGKLFADDFKYNDALSTDDLAAWAKSQGFDSIKFNQVKDRGPQGVFANEQSSLPSNNAAIFNPQNIRSRFAAFDPMKKESSNLLATSAAIAPTATMAAYLYNQERNKGGKQ